MLQMGKNQAFKISMLASILMLLCFVVYFLLSEYDKAKELLITQEKEAVYENLFTHIDTLHHRSDPNSMQGNVQWVKDTLGASVSYTLSFVSDSLNYNSPTQISKTFRNHELIEERIIGGEQEIELILMDEPRDSTIKFMHKSMDVDSNEFKQAFKMEDKVNDVLQDYGILKILKKGDTQSMEFPTLEIKSSSIIKAIIPQIFFSLILVSSVCLSFYLISKSLLKERKLSELRNDFMSNMSHELKTPVSTISVALEALSNFDAADKPELRKEYINISKLEIERLGLLVDKTLNLNLFEQGKFVYYNQRFDLKVELEKIIKILQFSLDNQNAEIKFSFEGSDFLIFADKMHLVNVIHNLIENAIKYSIDTAHIHIWLTEKANDLVLEVNDDGIGIAEKYQSSVFDKFFRVPSGEIHNVKGHGLGLSYVKQVVESHGGSIVLDSKLGEGCSFKLFFPKMNEKV